MEQLLKEKIVQGIGLWVISWVFTIVIAIIDYHMLSKIALIFVADIIFPIMTLALISKQKQLKKEKEDEDK